MRGACLGLCAAGFATSATLAPVAVAGTSDAQITIGAGALSVTTPDFQGVGATLSGSDLTLSTTPATPWQAIDARGTGAPWTVVASASDLVSAGTPDRVVPSSALALTTGAVAAGAGADPATGMTGAAGAVFTTPTGPGQTNVTILSAPGSRRGAYTFVPTLDITVPATAQPSYSGSPYMATLTVTIS